MNNKKTATRKPRQAKPLTIDEVSKRSVYTLKRVGVGRKNHVMDFVLDGHYVRGTNVVWYKEGDGERYGFASDARLRECLCHGGFRAVKIR